MPPWRISPHGGSRSIDEPSALPYPPRREELDESIAGDILLPTKAAVARKTSTQRVIVSEADGPALEFVFLTHESIFACLEATSSRRSCAHVQGAYRAFGRREPPREGGGSMLSIQNGSRSTSPSWCRGLTSFSTGTARNARRSTVKARDEGTHRRDKRVHPLAVGE